MGIPSDNKNQIIRSRQEPDPAAFSVKPKLDEDKGEGLRGQDKKQSNLSNDDLPNNGFINPEVRMTTPPTTRGLSEEDQRKVGLQDDHDPRDIGQQQNDKPKEDFKSPKQPSGPYDRDKKDEHFPPGDESKFG